MCEKSGQHFCSSVVDAYGQARLLAPSHPPQGLGHCQGLTLDLQLQKRKCKEGIKAGPWSGDGIPKRRSFSDFYMQEQKYSNVYG